ncbi:MAG: hypothetical protein ACRDJP_08270, partial [Actinomycetota bacterium]
MTNRRGSKGTLMRGIGILVVGMVAAAALQIAPASGAKKALTKKKGDKRYVNEGQAAASFGTVTAGDFRYAAGVT